MKAEIKNNRLKNIIANAEHVFFEKGFSKTSISDICKAVNCSRTTLYSHFENKENIYLAVINNSFTCFLDYFITLKIDGKNGLDKILGYAKGYIDFARKFPKNYLMILDFYTLLRSIDNKALQSDAAALLSKCSFFPKVKKNAEIPFTFLVAVIKEGQKDKSINPNISADVLFLNIWAYLMGSSHLYDFSSDQNINLSDLKMKSIDQNILFFIEKMLT